MSNVKSNKRNKDKLIRHERGRPSFVVVDQQQPPRYSSGLYVFVYKSVYTFVVSILLTVSFLLQGVYVVSANEGADNQLVMVEVPAIIDSVPDDSKPSVDPAAAEDEPYMSEVVPEVSVSAETDVSLVDGSIAEDLVTIGTTIEDFSTTSTSDSDNASTGSSNDDGYTFSQSSSTVPDATSTPISTSTDLLDAEALSEVIGPALDTPLTVTYTDSGYTFSKSECTELASGSFYCIEPRVDVLEDALFAAPDADGDLEIFLVRENVQTQITDNFVDDAAPYYDQNSHTIVWHRLIDDRYQIVSYDIEERTETLLTNGTTNNMEPTRQGRYTVWQRWVGNNWDIILHDGSTERQVSHAVAHDIAPYIHGSLVVWNQYTMTGDKTVEMYDIANESYVTVDDPTGLTVSNPRMVLVYDQMHPNGDIITKGYDMIARSFIALDTLPRDLPDEVPSSEPTSETRALIQVKPNLKGDEALDSEGDDGPVLVPEFKDASSSDPLTLDLGSATNTETYTSAPPSDLTEFDLVIEPFSSSSRAVDSVQGTSS